MNSDLDLLLRLRDVHPPQAPFWWPPAPGWWIVLALVLVCAWLLARWLPPRARQWYQQYQLNRELNRLEVQLREGSACAQLAGQLSALLRHAVLVKTQNAALAGVYGDAWVAFFLAHIPDCEELVTQPALLTTLPYQTEVTRDEVEQLATIVRRFINTHTRNSRC